MEKYSVNKIILKKTTLKIHAMVQDYVFMCVSVCDCVPTEVLHVVIGVKRKSNKKLNLCLVIK